MSKRKTDLVVEQVGLPEHKPADGETVSVSISPGRKAVVEVLKKRPAMSPAGKAALVSELLAPPSEKDGEPGPPLITPEQYLAVLKGTVACVVCGTQVAPGEVCAVDGHRDGTVTQ